MSTRRKQSRLKAALFVAGALFVLNAFGDGPRGLRASAAAPSSAPQSDDEAAVLSALAVEYFTRYGRRDLEGLLALWSPQSPDLKARREATEKFFAAHERLALSNLTVRRAVATADVTKATARVDFELSADGATAGTTGATLGAMRRVLHFVKEADGAWKVWREESAEEDLAAALGEAKTEAARDALLAQEKELLNKELVRALLKQSDGSRLRGDFEQALERFGVARSLATRIGDKAGESDALYGIGFIQRVRGDYAPSLDNFKRSRTLREELGDTAKTASSINQVGYIYYLQGNHDLAMEHYRKGLALSEALRDQVRIADALMNIADIEGDLGDYGQALENYQKGAALAEAAGSKSVLSRALNDAASIHRILGNYGQALENYGKSLQLFEAIGDRGRVGIILNNIGTIYRLQGDYEQALTYYRRSLSQREAQGSKPGIMASLNNIGEIQALQGERAQALENFQRSLKLSEELGDRRNGAVILNNLGHLYRAQGDYGRSLDYYQRSLTIREALGNQEGISGTLNGLSLIYRLRGDYTQAASFAERSIRIARHIGSRENLHEALTLAATSYGALNQTEEARRAFEEAIGIIESLRAGLVGQETRATYFASVREPYDLYVYWLMQLHRRRPAEGHDARAWQVNERGRARSLLEALTEARADIRQGVDSALVERERVLQQQFNAAAERQTRLLSGKHTAEQAASLKQRIDALSAEYRDVQAEIRRRSPRYAALTQPAPLTLREVQQQVLDRDTMLLQYALGEERSYLWAATPDSLASFELPSRAVIETQARRVYELLTDAGAWATDERADERYEQSAGALSRMLIPSALAAQTGKKRLVVVTDGVLQYLPFGALPVPEVGDSVTRGRARPLIVDHEIVSLPSASALAVLRRETAKRARAPKGVAVLADPVFDARDERVGIAARAREATPPGSPATPRPEGLPAGLAQAARATGMLRGDQQGLSRLPFSRREAEMILARVPAGAGFKVLDFEASRETALGPELGRYRYVHFATHGLLNSEHPELSGVVLSLVDEHGRPRDGFLRLNEIYNLQLSAEMVVLSACQTALGKEVRGEGLIGLTRGFMYAGSPRVVASLWKVDDRATAELMRRFYEGVLVGRLRPAEALRAAKMGMLKDDRWSGAYYWAAFELQGEWK